MDDALSYGPWGGLSSRRACALLSVARSTLGYPSRLVVRDAPAVAAMRDLGDLLAVFRTS